MSSVVISGLRSPTNTWKWPGRVTNRQWRCCNGRSNWSAWSTSGIFTSSENRLVRLLTACVFLLAGWCRGPVHLDLLSQEKTVGESKQRGQGVRHLPQSQSTGSFCSFWLDVLHSHHFYSCDRELQLIRFVSVGHHYTCISIANFFLIYLCIK